MKASIIGGGIGGLSTAIALRKQNIPFELYEASQDLKPLGAGIILSPNALYIYDQLGLLEQLNQAGQKLEQFGMKTASGKQIQSTTTIFTQHGETHQSIGIHRAELQRILLENLDSKHIHLGKELEKLEPEESLLSFTDGETLKADLIIAADGIHSKVRQSLFPDTSYRYSGQSCWRGVANTQLSHEELKSSAEYWGTGLRFGFVPISPNKTYWYAASVQPQNQKDTSSQQAKSELKQALKQFSPVILKILEATPDDKIMRHDLSDITPLANWHKHNTVLLGDAAHAMTPNMGQGAAQSIEDAWALSHALGHALKQNKSLENAFMTYTQQRIKKANNVVKLSWQIGQISNWQNPLLCGLRNIIMKLPPKSVTQKQTQKLFNVPSYAAINS